LGGRLVVMSELVRVTRGVWRPATAVEDVVGRAAAMLTAAPAGSVIAGIAAARIHRLWLPERADERIDMILRCDADVPEAHAGSRRSELRGRRRRLQPDEVQIVHGVPVTTVARTWLDLGECLPLADLIAAGDSALRLGVSLDELVSVVSRGAHRRGIVAVRKAVPLLDRRAESRPESHLRYALVSNGLPKPSVNTSIHDMHGQWLSVPDLSYEDVRLALEYNGAVHASERRMRKGITRDFDVGARGGWRTEVFGPAEVFGKPDQVAVYVREIRRERMTLFR
jgi:hypothetical protein